MNNIVRFFDQSAVHISNWPKNVLHWLTLVWLLAHSCFWGFGNHVGNFFWFITQGSFRSIRLWSIRNDVYNIPNFFSRSRLRSNRTLFFLVKIYQKPFGQCKIWSKRVLQKIGKIIKLYNNIYFHKYNYF